MAWNQGTSNKTRWAIISVVCVIALCISAFSAFTRNIEHSGGDDDLDTHKPFVSWSTNAVVQTLSPGESNAVVVSFTASQNLNNVSLAVSPTLRSLVQVDPVSVPVVAKGQPVSVTLHLQPPATSSPAILRGKLHLWLPDDSSDGVDHNNRDGFSKNGDPKIRSLPIVLNIVWATYSNAPAGVQLSYPDFGLPSRVDVSSIDTDTTLLDVQFQSTSDTNFVSGFGVSLFKNVDHLNLLDWFHKFIDPKGTLVTAGTFTTTTLANGLSALIRSGPVSRDYVDEFGPVMPIYVISQSGNTIYSITQSQTSDLNTYGLTPDQIEEMLREVITSVQAP